MQRNRLELLLRAARECGPIAFIQVGPIPLVSICDPALIHEVLAERVHEFAKSPDYRFMRSIMGYGLVTCLETSHKRQRRLVAPAFTPRRVHTYADTMTRMIEERQAAWRDGDVIDLTAELSQLTLEIVCKTLFDIDMDSNSLAAVRDVAHLGNQWIWDELTSFIRLPISAPRPRNVRMRRAIRQLDALLYRLIRERRASGEDRGDILSMLLLARDEDGDSLSDQEIRDEAVTMLLAGHETTANGLTWAFTLLARHPEVMDRLRTEAAVHLQGRLPVLEDLPHLPYALQVFKESMRLYPPVMTVGRTPVHDLELGGYPVRPGQVVVVFIYGMHHREDLYPDPERFDPERFTPENEKRLPRGAFLPFLAGPRVCIGNHFALMEGQLVLAHLAQRLTLELLPGQSLEHQALVTLRPRNNVHMRVRRHAR